MSNHTAKNKRFALADSIRMLENDTVTNKTNLQILRIKADELKSEPGRCRFLKQKMDILFQTKLTTQEKKTKLPESSFGAFCGCLSAKMVM
ncbi:MAG: hypothetical protein IPL20_15555 [Saprospiraceae bacterium]|nr:hypothetical protein [Saprospiraceae bacterium]